MTLHQSAVIQILSAEQCLGLSGKTRQPERNNRFDIIGRSYATSRTYIFVNMHKICTLCSIVIND